MLFRSIDVVADRALHLEHLGPGCRYGPQQEEDGRDERPGEPHRTSKAAERWCRGTREVRVGEREQVSKHGGH